MPPLDPKDEQIIAAYIRNGGNQTSAWKSAHPESKAKPASIYAKASAFFKQDKVRLRIVEAQAEVADRLSAETALSLEEHMKKLKELRDKALSLNQLSAAIKAEHLRGELRRFYVKQVETGDAGDFSRMSDEELKAFVFGDQEDLQIRHVGSKSKH